MRKKDLLLMALFAMCAIVMEAAMARAFQYGKLIETLVHAGIYLIFFVFYVIYARKVLERQHGKQAVSVATVLIAAPYVIASILLIGFSHYIAALIVSIVVMALPFGFIFRKNVKRSILSAVVALILLFGLSVPGYFYRLFEISARERTVELYVSEENGYFVHAVPTEKLYIYTDEPKTTADVLFHNSLQAYTCRKYSDQIMYERDVTLDPAYTAQHLETISKYYPDVEQVRVNTQDELLELYAGRIENYILYDDNDRQSYFVAANLCYQMDAVMVGKSIVNVAESRGWKKVFDATGWTEKAFMASEYFDKLDRHLLFMMDTTEHNMPSYHQDRFMAELWDVAMMNNSWIVYNDFTLTQLEGCLKKLKRNSICIGSVGENAENAVVQACARYSTTFVYTRYTANMSVLSGFYLQNATAGSEVLTGGEINKVEPAKYSDDSTPKHTVCVMLSDADNVRFCTESLMSSAYYQSPARTEALNYNIGLAGSMVEIAPLFLLEFYDRMYPSNDFCYQLSSIGYTYPSKWTDEEAWEQVTKSLVRIMDESKTNVLEIMDDSAFMTCLDIPSTFGKLKKYFDTYTKYDEVDGCLFIDYTALYAGYRGAVCWSNGKPVVSAKYSVWWDEGTPYNSKRNTIDYIVKEINEASTDKTKEEAYTFIIVHGWSGLDENGDLVQLSLKKKNVDSTAIFKALQDSFDEDVEMVTTTEFIARMKRNVQPH